MDEFEKQLEQMLGYQQMLGYLEEFDEFVEDRMLIVRREMENTFSQILECPRCRQYTVAIDAEGAFCHFCRYRSTGKEPVRQLVEKVAST